MVFKGFVHVRLMYFAVLSHRRTLLDFVRDAELASARAGPALGISARKRGAIDELVKSFLASKTYSMLRLHGKRGKSEFYIELETDGQNIKYNLYWDGQPGKTIDEVL